MICNYTQIFFMITGALFWVYILLKIGFYVVDKLLEKRENSYENSKDSHKLSGGIYNNLIKIIEENDRLKSDLTAILKSNVLLKNELAETKKQLESHNINYDLYCDLQAENEQLKSELERSVKLPCSVGGIVYAYSTYFGILAYEINSIHICCGISFEAIASRNDDILDSFDFDIEDIGKTIFLTREEAEQSLKGQVER